MGSAHPSVSARLADLEHVGVGGAGDLPQPEAVVVGLAGLEVAEQADDVGLGLHHDHRRAAVGADGGGVAAEDGGDARRPRRARRGERPGRTGCG